eukprot:TRINITY_DN906_c0_g1_i1.p1 TRINITY_DN906_c0_g1~~TRINITY_DN906_c0_g1_i1.p1  ORF type:complete len:573 (-),score=149.93 TRINITY_DN906_c0_g1_i1:82-1800(-)
MLVRNLKKGRKLTGKSANRTRAARCYAKKKQQQQKKPFSPAGSQTDNKVSAEIPLYRDFPQLKNMSATTPVEDLVHFPEEFIENVDDTGTFTGGLGHAALLSFYNECDKLTQQYGSLDKVPSNVVDSTLGPHVGSSDAAKKLLDSLKNKKSSDIEFLLERTQLAKKRIDAYKNHMVDDSFDSPLYSLDGPTATAAQNLFANIETASANLAKKNPKNPHITEGADLYKYISDRAIEDTLEPIRVAVTGAAGNIGYSLLFRIASGSMFGNRPVILQLLEIPQGMKALEGTVMELKDSAFPLVKDIIFTDKPEVAFEGVDYALLVGSKPRSAGMERSDLLKENANVFSVQGKALNKVAKGAQTKVAVVGNPANTNAMIAQLNAPNIPAENFSAMTRLDHNRAVGQLSKKLGVKSHLIKNFTIWGNHSSTQVPDLYHATVLDGARLATGEPMDKVADLIQDDAWVFDTFMPTVQQRGAAIIKARGASSAASAASSLVDHVRSLIRISPHNWTSMAVCSNGEYGTTPGLFYSFPVHTRFGKWEIVKDLEISEQIADLMKASNAELASERDAVKDYLP